MAFTLGLILDAILLSLATRITPHVSEAAVGALNNRFESDVEIGSLQVSVFPRPEIIGSDLVLRLEPFNRGSKRGLSRW